MIIAVDDHKKIYFSFNTEIQSVVETFMIRLGYGNTDYYLEYDSDDVVAKLFKQGFVETEVQVISIMLSDSCDELMKIPIYLIV